MLRKLILSLLLIGGQIIQAQNALDILGLTSMEPANVAFSVRKLSSNYTGPLFRLLVGAAYYDVYPDASVDQHLSMSSKISAAVSYSDPIASPTSASLSSLAITNAYVAIWYDQSGNANHLKNPDNTLLPNIIYNGSITTEGPNGKPFVKWIGVTYWTPPKYLSLSNLITNNGQVIIVNKFSEDGFLLGDNNIFLGGGGQGSYRWHSGPHLSPQRLFDENGWATPSIRNGAIYQDGIFRAGNLSTTYNQTLGINAVAPTNSSWEDTYWDNIGEERVNAGSYHSSADNSGYSEVLSFPNGLSNTLRANVESSQSDYFGIALYGRVISITAPLVNPLVSNCSAPGPSAPTTFDVTGASLSAAVIVSAPLGFEISENASSSFTSSINLIPDGSGTVSATLYVRLAAGFFNVSGNISASSPGATTQYATISSTFVAAPAFSPAGPFLMCTDATYLVALSTPNSFNGWSSSNSGIFSVTGSGYITANQAGTATITYTDACGQSVSQTVIVQSSAPLIPLADNSIAYRFNGSPQGPVSNGATINYVGYDGYSYLSQTRPTNVGFYKANIQSDNQAGCPNRFYIFTCTTCDGFR